MVPSFPCSVLPVHPERIRSAAYHKRLGDLLFFDCPFDDTLDEYGTEFKVFKIKDDHRNDANQPS